MGSWILSLVLGSLPGDLPDLFLEAPLEDLAQRYTLEQEAEADRPVRRQGVMADFVMALVAYRYGLRTERRTQRNALKDCVRISELAFTEDLQPLADALRSSCLGSLIARSPMLGGMRHGGTARAAIDRAMAARPDHPFVRLHKAISELYTPRTWGGDVAAARARLLGLVAELEGEPTSPWHWLLPDALGFLALAEIELENPGAARAALERARALRPAYGWLRSVVAPRVAELR